MREVNLETEMVSTLMTKENVGIHNGLSIALDPTGDTLFLLNDNNIGAWDSRWNMPAVYYSLRKEGFNTAVPYQYAQCCYSGVWMSDGSFYYNTYESGMMLRGRGTWNAERQKWDGKPLFSTSVNKNSGHQYMHKHPSENYIYVTGNQNVVRKVNYNKAERTFTDENVQQVAGQANGGAGFNAGTGTTAAFNYTRQGVFVKNPDYTGSELYDFYMCDQKNHCIWKITPTGIATVFAGRGTPTLNNEVKGWIDGHHLKSARFDQPNGLAYDEETGIFYVADRENRRIRTIMIE